MSVSIQEDCVGLILLIGLVEADGVTPVSLVNATSIVFFVSAPNGTTVQRNGYAYGANADGVVGHTTTGADFRAAGPWKYQARATYSTGVILYSTVQKIKVKPNIQDEA